ncbi:MAG TPA: outer membrane beta-barrel protein [Thermodesulfobacteriota bacterium]|nr:outer membrane beta-barrel protein [Thermodesulfobacteriota bacterium]
MKKIFIALLVCGLFAGGGTAYAEPYISIYSGAAFPHDSDTTGEGVDGEVEFDPGVTAGVDFGYWLTAQNAPFLGFEVDLNSHLPRAEKFRPLLGPVADTDTDLTVYSATASVLVRSPEGWMRPYAGGGVGWFFADIADGALSTPVFGVPASFSGDEDDALGWQFFAGVDFFVLPGLALYAEYKYNIADFDFPDLGIKVDYRISQVNGGISYHFGWGP